MAISEGRVFHHELDFPVVVFLFFLFCIPGRSESSETAVLKNFQHGMQCPCNNKCSLFELFLLLRFLYNRF